MKTLSRTFTFKVLALLAIGAPAALMIRAFAQGPSPQRPAYAERKLVLKFAKDTEVKDEAGFKNILIGLGQDQYKIHYRHEDNTSEDFPPPPHPLTGSIKTDKVTASELAKSAPTGKFTAIGSHVSYNITSDKPEDIRNVLATLK